MYTRKEQNDIAPSYSSTLESILDSTVESTVENSVHDEGNMTLTVLKYCDTMEK